MTLQQGADGSARHHDHVDPSVEKRANGGVVRRVASRRRSRRNEVLDRTLGVGVDDSDSQPRERRARVDRRGPIAVAGNHLLPERQVRNESRSAAPA